MTLPTPDPEAQKISNLLLGQIRDEIAQSGPLSFAQYMERALYSPGLGYYSGGAIKFGKQGDFITAPEISPLFAGCLAKQITSVLDHMGGGDILEFGAGSGRLAANLLKSLENSDHLPKHYFILELSAELQQRQHTLLLQEIPHLIERVVWLNKLPTTLEGVVLANEVLDAMPVHRFYWGEHGLSEYKVDWQNNYLEETLLPPHPNLIHKVHELGMHFAAGYSSEINLALSSWITSVANFLHRGLILLIDYGFPRHEYYHPDRWMGTLMCHYQHRAHANAFWWPGLQDITAHVDFTAVADAGIHAGCTLAGYNTLAHFLLGCGLTEMAVNMTTLEPFQIAQEIKKLLMPSEMGELFKVIGLTKHLDLPLMGFALHDLRERLHISV